MQSFEHAGTSVSIGRPDPSFNPRTQNQPQMYANRYGDTAVGGSAHVQLGDVIIQNYDRAAPQKSLYEVLLASLRFEQMDSRLRSVEHALPSTCQWVFSHNKFLAWASVNDSQHQPFLWIKGKPGSGKSTIMKEILTWAEKAWSQKTLTLTYFFNARSPDRLEKSGLGLYQSLLHQILANCPASRDPFVKGFAPKVSESGNVAPWTSAELQNFHTELIKNGCLPPLVILIDALDEGDEDDVRLVVRFLSRLQQYAREENHPIQVAFSSRHYPNITIERSLSLTVEDTPEHDEDISIYIRSELAHLRGTQFDDLKAQIRRRSAGVFLWVVLVVPTIKKAYDRGKSFTEIARKLDEMPSDLHDVFSRIVFRDSEDFDKCLKLLSWVLFSLHTLSPMELYSALEQAPSDSGFDRDFTCTNESATRYILHCSRGLVEITEGEYPVVQLIHETVRDYLMCQSTYRGLSAGLVSMVTASPMLQPRLCHMSIAEDCLRYLVCLRLANPVAHSVDVKYLHSEYAANCWWRHVQMARTDLDQRLVCIASEFLIAYDPVSKWIQACGGRHNGFDHTSAESWLSYDDFCRNERGRLENLDKETKQYDLVVPPVHFAASVGISKLLSRVLSMGVDVNAPGDPFGHALTAASYYNDENIVEMLLDKDANVNAQGGFFGNALQAASLKWYTETVQILLDKGANVNAVGGHYRTALRAATSMRREKTVQLLLQHGATVDDPNEYYSPLQKAAVLGHLGIAKLLLSYGANVHRRGRFGSALTLAAGKDDLKMVQLLLEHGADPNDDGSSGRTTLHIACGTGSEDLVKLLMDHGADKEMLPDMDELLAETTSRMVSRKIKKLYLNYFPESCPKLDEEKYVFYTIPETVES